MKLCRQGILVVAILCGSLISYAKSDCVVNSADNCLQTSDLQHLPSSGNLSLFCTSAASLVYKVKVCLDECAFDSSNNIRKFFTTFEDVCSDTLGCQNIDRFYSDFQSCFNSSGGLSKLLNDLITAFNNKENVNTFCRFLSHGKNCMDSAAANCSYLADLMSATFELYGQFAIARHICGSENVPIVSDKSNCANSRNMIANINRECDISCSISATDDSDTICRFLQLQVDCFLRWSVGCTDTERRFILPRLNTYAIANLLLGCSAPIRLQGVSVQPTGLDRGYPDNFRCKYIDQLNDCFDFKLPRSGLRPDVVQRLMNGNFLVDYFCDLKAINKLFADELIAKCVNSFLRCRLPAAEIYQRAFTYDELPFNSSLAPFPLDYWGLSNILSSLQCPNPAPPTLCKRSLSTKSPSGPLQPTRQLTKRTTPPNRTVTPRAGGSKDNSVNEPQQLRQGNAKAPGSMAAPTYRPTPKRETPKP